MVTLDTGEVLLIDTGPDLRQQALREGMNRVDAVLYTHTHADHLHGIDDLRAFCQLGRQQIPLYARYDAAEHIRTKFAYTLREPSAYWDLPVLALNEIADSFVLFNQTVVPIPIHHGKMIIFGYRIGNMAYLTDVSDIPESSFSLLQGLDLLLIDCLRHHPHPTHIGLEQSLDYINQIRAKQNVMIHMTHELEFDALTQLLPENVIVGFDGLKLVFH
jgi:phosphoribosyl 1,2-cyclic phosphate phosphodiesterase